MSNPSTNSPKGKRCSKCFYLLPATSKFFGKEKRNNSGLAARCRTCSSAAVLVCHRTESGKVKARATVDKYQATIRGHLNRAYHNIIARCENPKARAYKSYGGKGIKCMFKSAEAFYDYVTKVLCIDPRGLVCHRPDSTGHYEPNNIEYLTETDHKEFHYGTA
jgi:hypothetical protein